MGAGQDFESTIVASRERRSGGFRVVALAAGALALVSANMSRQVDAAVSKVPSGHYQCPEDYLNLSFSPIQKLSIFDETTDNSDYTKANLVVIHDDSAYDLTGAPVHVDNGCVGSSFDQYQVGNSGFAPAEGVTVEVSLPDDPAGSVLNPHNLAGNKILKVTQTDVGSYKLPDKTEKPVNSYILNYDQTSVTWTLPTTLSHGQQSVFRVYSTSKNPVFGQDYVVRVRSNTPEINSADDSVHYRKNIYPNHLNISDQNDQPRFSNGRIRRLGRGCIVRPIRISPPRSIQSNLGPRQLNNGRAVADVYYSKTRDFSHASHRRIKVPFAAITDLKPLSIPIKACNTPGQKFVDTKLSVSAANTLDAQPFRVVAHLVRAKKVRGKLLRGPAWSFERVLR